MRRCPNCGYSTENNEKFCQFCGSALIDENSLNLNTSNKCNNCGNIVDEKNEYCPYCGHKLKEPKEDFTINNSEEDVFDQYYSNNNTASSSKVCPKCGTTYNSILKECPNCSKGRYNYPTSESGHNSSTNNTSNNNSIGYGIICIIASVFTGIVGIVMSIVGISKFKNSKPTLILCIISLILGIVILVANVALFLTGESDEIFFYL